MVGVPGKYKGCETCRLRRVKCDNQRPFCKKCLDGGRDCAGYERETVFIIGTIEDQGRCSSHPPRVVKSSKKGGSSKASVSPKRSGEGRSPRRGEPAGRRSPRQREEGRLLGGVVPKEPLRPAWDDLVSVSCGGKSDRLQVAALHTGLRDVMRTAGDEAGGESVFVSLPPYEPPNVQPGLGGEETFQLASQCLMNLATPGEGQGGTATDNICLFLYENNPSSYFGGQSDWKDASAQTNTIRSLGPEHFRSFPAHHFFARVYRPNAIVAALQTRTPTFLASSHWLSTPFANHPKSSFDRLLDILAAVASLLARADHVLAQAHTLTRRLTSQELLNVCLDLELDLSRWYSSLNQHLAPGSHQNPHQYQQQQQAPLFWLTHPSSQLPSRSPSPFSSTPPPTNQYRHHSNNNHPFPAPALTFRSPQTALCLVHYWTGLTLLYPTIWRLYFAAVIDPVVVADTPPTTTSSSTPNYTQPLSPPQHHLPHQHHQHHQPLPTQHQHQHQHQQPMQISTTNNLETPMDNLDLNLDLSLGLNMGGVGMGMGLGIPVASLPVPARLQALDVMRYSLGRVRQVAGDVCRGMDFVVDDGGGGGGGDGGRLVQPDLLWGVLGVVGRFFGGLVVGDGGEGEDYQYHPGGGMGLVDGRLEVLWCEGFRERLMVRGREMREVVVGRRWVDLGAF